MELVVTAVSVNLHNGILRNLTESQYRDRAHHLKKIDDGSYEIVRPVQFKRGERVDFDGEVNPTLLAEVQASEAEGESQSGELAPITKSALQKLSREKILVWASDNNIVVDQEAKKAELITSILEQFSSEEGEQA